MSRIVQWKLSKLVKQLAKSEKFPRSIPKFNSKDTMWLVESRGVALKDRGWWKGCSRSDDSQSVIDCLLKESNQLQIEIKKVLWSERDSSTVNGYRLVTESRIFWLVGWKIIATGRIPKMASLWIFLNHLIIHSSTYFPPILLSLLLMSQFGIDADFQLPNWIALKISELKMN